MLNTNKAPLGSKILIWDLETAGINALNADFSVIVNFGYKWLGEKDAHVITIDQYPNWFAAKKGLNDKPLLEETLSIMEQADILVAHYGDRFDRPFFKGRCILNGLTPPPDTKTRDTWYIAYKNFKFSRNSLVHLADILGLNQKKHHKSCPDEWPGWWLRTLAGDKTAIHEMAEYCRQDVQTLEQVYLRLQPYDNAHPYIYEDRARCGVCGGEIQYRGTAIALKNRFRRFVCKKCGRWGRDTKKIIGG
jgi:uncharacterized protein YprB with RNaseH-like and TPR domain